MTSLLRGVATRGTAAAAASLDWPVAGKTGTMDDYTDAWFIGFDPDITIGVWVGFDEKKSLGRGETGTTAALPIWLDVMKARLEARPRTQARVRGTRQHRRGLRRQGHWRAVNRRGHDQRDVHRRHAAGRGAAADATLAFRCRP